jgi:alpha-L-arabinofuranosidase
MARLLGLLALATVLIGSHALDIRVTKTKNVTIPSTLFGYMFEDINHSGDGGLYGMSFSFALLEQRRTAP